MHQELHTYLSKFDHVKCKNYNFSKVFMFVRNYCHYSKDAAALAEKLVPGKVECLDLESKLWVTPNDLKQTMIKKSPLKSHLISRFNEIKFSTVPQIFVHGLQGWKYVGGKTDFDTFTKSSSSLEDIQIEFQDVKL